MDRYYGITLATALRAVIFGSQIPSYTPPDAGNENETYDACCAGGSSDHEASATALYKLNDLLPKLYTQAEAA